jgi:hypothetical protein
MRSAIADVLAGSIAIQVKANVTRAGEGTGRAIAAG